MTKGTQYVPRPGKNEDGPAPQKSKAGVFNTLAFAGTIGLHMVSGIVVGGLIGYALDKWFETGPLLTGIFLLIGIAAGFKNVYRDAKRLIASQEWNTYDADTGGHTKDN